MKITRHRLMLALISLAFGVAFYKASVIPEPAAFQWPAMELEQGNGAAQISSRFVSSSQNISTHAASLIELSDGRIRAFWFAGSREGAEDVEIRTAVLDPASNKWGNETAIADRHSTQQSLLRFVKKIGNPVPARLGDGTLQLFYVTVSVGGWAGSSITFMTSDDDGETWSPARRLVTSPFINISTLVKGTPFKYADGSLGLPVYHEFLGKFSELLRIAPGGDIIDKQRLSDGKLGIQPVILIKNPEQAMILMRHVGPAPKRVIAATTVNAGKRWNDPEKTELANPDAAITGVARTDGRLLVALNDTESNREVLSLVASNDGGASWQKVYTLEDQRSQTPSPASYIITAALLARETDNSILNPALFANTALDNQCSGEHCRFEFSYPYMIQAHNGEFHLVYTWNRSFIKHVRFTRAWLDQRMKANQHAQLD